MIVARSSGFATDYYIFGGTPPYSVAATFPDAISIAPTVVGASGGFFRATTNGTCVNPVTFSIVDFGALLYIFLTLESGVSQATRFAVTNTATPGMTREQSIMNAMRTATPTLTLPDSAFTFSFMAPGASTFTNGAAGGPGDIGKVQVNYTWNIMTPLIRPFFTGHRSRTGLGQSHTPTMSSSISTA